MKKQLEKYTILIAEDNLKIRKLMKQVLELAGATCFDAGDGKEAMKLYQLHHTHIDLLLLDWMMPELSGLDVVSIIRETSTVPIIMVTAKSETDDVLDSFKEGVDDYITKPIMPDILIARVSAVLRRVPKQEEELRINTIVLDRKSFGCLVDDKRIDISKKEFELLYYFFVNRGVPLSREQIISRVWGFDFDGDYRIVDTYIKTLRKKIAPYTIIKTVHGRGYTVEEDK